MKKILYIILGIVLAAVIAVGCIWGKEIASVASIKSVDGNHYLFSMEYKANYDLDDVLAHDIDGNAKLGQYVANRIGKGLFHITIESNQLADENGEYHGFGCTSFQTAKADGSGYWYGRNYDYFENPTLVVTSHPKKGYASISCCDMSHFGFSLDKRPVHLADKFMCLAAIYTPLDGVNEKGLCFMTEPLEADKEITGHPMAHVFVEMTDPGYLEDNYDFDVFVTMSDYDPETGAAFIFSDGHIRTSLRSTADCPYDFLGLPWHPANEADASYVDLGEVYQLDIDLMPTSYIVKEGHSIIVTLSNAMDRFYYLGRAQYEADPEVAGPSFNFYTGGEHATSIELPHIYD